MTNQTDPIKAAVTLLGGQANTARKLAVSAGLVWQWVNGKRPVGPAHCPVIERETGIRCELLRQDVGWIRDEDGRVIGQHIGQ
jgi:DNA-binding transcriptional regulator YdaS (Cro superfamily)